jgi:hypothetical protein
MPPENRGFSQPNVHASSHNSHTWYGVSNGDPKVLFGSSVFISTWKDSTSRKARTLLATVLAWSESSPAWDLY